MVKFDFYIILLLLVFPILVFGGSLYYSEDFNPATFPYADWNTNFRYGRDGLVNPGPSNTSVVKISNETLKFRGWLNRSPGDPTVGDWANYGHKWIGHSWLYNKEFSASPENPFGYEIIRKQANVDVGDENNFNKIKSLRLRGEVSIWLVYDTGNVQNEWDQYLGFVSFYELGRPGLYLSKWGFYDGNYNEFPLDGTATFRPDGRTYNLKTSSTIYNPYGTGIRWLYDDNDIDGGDTILTNVDQREVPVGSVGTTNTNTMALRITHDGSKIRFYINPDPYNANEFVNEFVLVGETEVWWTNKLKIMLCHEGPRPDHEACDMDLDNLLIRSVAKTIKSEITPAEVGTDEIIDFAYILRSTFSDTDSGIGEIKLYKPAIFTSSWSDVKIWTEWGDGKDDGILAQLENIYSGAPVNKQVLIVTNGNELKLRFCQQSDSVHNVIKESTINKQIEIKFRLKTPTTPSPAGEDFQCYVNCIKYSNTAYSFNSTTADKKAVSGNDVSICNSEPSLDKSFNTTLVETYKGLFRAKKD